MKTFNFELLHPMARGRFIMLANDLAEAFKAGDTRTLFLPFEGYRPPERQDEVFKAGKSKVRAWGSPHQFGLAVDFVPKVNGRWTWAAEHDYDFLRRAALVRGLHRPISWDLVHIEHPAWEIVRQWVKPEVSGSSA